MICKNCEDYQFTGEANPGIYKAWNVQEMWNVYVENPSATGANNGQLSSRDCRS